MTPNNVWHGSNGLTHATIIANGGAREIACNELGDRDFVVARDPLPKGTRVTCVPCLVALLSRQ
jgi:hypothetical protein